MSSARPRQVPVIEDAALAALQDTLAAEHAALWSYGLAVAFLPEDLADEARADAAAHARLRAAVEQTLTDLGRRPVSALPAYATPFPVEDADAAARLAVVAESDALVSWRAVLERTADRTLREAALDALTGTTLRSARWRERTGERPAVPTFPGRP
ncbi:MAG TPA: ferritin-like domain-containing protein [Pseudonocardia sp.]|jgi:hypothetical protein|nr:ferritin-like domain-containing protein [Pseudonocardia sp.]